MSKIYEEADLRDMEDKLLAYVNLELQIGDLESRKKELRRLIEDRMGDAERGYARGYEVYWIKKNGRRDFDKKAFMEAHQEIDYSPYMKIGMPTRAFKVIKKEEGESLNG